MNKSEFTTQVADRAGISKGQAAKVIDAIFAPDEGIIARALRKGDKLSLTGFGTFGVSRRAARTGRNPRTGQPIQIPASRSASFRAGKTLKVGL
jgi:DNA-binding protein HU-beta